ncbi:MAG TPA: glycosyltransferase [Thermoanaerobaculia bacterium]|nr:glycosyltransferase [Thermoanaerobaculia bacterium]
MSGGSAGACPRSAASQSPARERGGTEKSVREITAVLVAWRDAGETESAVASLVAARKPPGAGKLEVSLVVVDNGGGLAGRDRIESAWPGATVLVNRVNRGLAAAANQAAGLAGGDVLLFLNPDTRAEGDPFSEIARAFEAHPEAAAVAPRLLDAEGKGRATGALAPPDREDQRTFQLRRLPTLRSDARNLLLLDHLFPDNAGRRNERYAARDRETPFEVEQAAAAALAVRRDAFRKIGGFDERFFPAWFEDVDLCARLSAVGTILYWPDARFRHRGRTSSETLGYAAFLPIYYRNALRYRDRYTVSARWAYRILLAAGMVLRLIALPFRRSLPRSRGEAAKAYLRTLAVASGWTPSASRRPPPDPA